MDFFSGLLGALSDFGSELSDILNQIFQFIVLVAEYIWNALVAVANFLFTILKDVGSFFAHIWNNFFKAIFTDIWKGILKFGQWLHNIFTPVLKFLLKVSHYIDRIYRTYVRPILRWISVARVFLNLLKALGVKWAAKLDTILGQVQRDIQQAFLTIKGYLNVLIDIANILADPTNLLRRPTTLLSIMRTAHAAIRMFTGLPPGFFIPAGFSGGPLGIGPLPANFNPNDPLQNPPASYYLAFDGGVPDFSGIASGDTIPDDAPDSISPLSFFQPNLDDFTDCDDAETCLDESVRLALQGR